MLFKLMPALLKCDVGTFVPDAILDGHLPIILGSFLEPNFYLFFGPLAFAILLVLLGFLRLEGRFWAVLRRLLYVHLVADLRWIQRRLSHRFRASSWLGLPLEIAYMFVFDLRGHSSAAIRFAD
jgi:hypothetical protein